MGASVFRTSFSFFEDFLASGSFAGRRTGLSGSISGGSGMKYALGVDPVGVGVHLVPRPVVKNGGRCSIGVLGRLGRDFEL